MTDRNRLASFISGPVPSVADLIDRPFRPDGLGGSRPVPQVFPFGSYLGCSFRLPSLR